MMPTDPPWLSIRKLSLAYGPRAVVEDFSLDLRQGSVGCLLGPSGCGKTTVLRAIAGFEPLRAGQILLDGEQISSAQRQLPPEQRRFLYLPFMHSEDVADQRRAVDLFARDGDANGDGIVETQDQALVTPFTVPALKAGKPTTIPRSALRTVTGQTAEVAVACKARIVNRSKGAIAPSGDIAAPTTKGLCDVVTNGDGVQITVVGDQPTRVTIKITAPATGEYKAFRQVEQVIVRSLVGRAIRKA